MNLRNQVIDFLRQELVGPDPIAPNVQSNGEEILTGDNPCQRYGAGVLFPSSTFTEESIDVIQPEGVSAGQPAAGLDGQMVQPDGDGTGQPADRGTRDNNSSDAASEAVDSTVSLYNAFLPSALGLSCLTILPAGGFVIKVAAATYRSLDVPYTDKNGVVKTSTQYLREPFACNENVANHNLDSNDTQEYKKDINGLNNKSTGLQLHILSRPYQPNPGGVNKRLLTVSLVNTHTSDKGRAGSDKCFFQVSLEMHSANGSACFLEYPEQDGITLDEEEKSLALLYRHKKTYAIGHGCAANWDDIAQGQVNTIRADILPDYEIKPIVPALLNGLTLKMLDFSDTKNPSNMFTMLDSLCNQYEAWIQANEYESTSSPFPEEHRETAARHIKSCRDCLNYMRSGIDVLKTDTTALKAFQLMNQAMLMQQLHYGMDYREWSVSANGIQSINPVQWPDMQKPPAGKGSWYAFQIAFILINLRSLSDPSSTERSRVDLIWFPTGGGKTEAYLGLTAFAILYRRLTDPNNAGTTVLMRYTLRLLTAQQFERAAALICSLEYLRLTGVTALGTLPISIGLWVGNAVTPGTRTEALANLNALLRGDHKNLFMLLKCPWCGAQMGPVEFGRAFSVIGYSRQRNPATVDFRCQDTSCFFSGNSPLPLLVIDEDIYEAPPTLLLGTIDKFAMLPWKPDAKSLFGIGAPNTNPPDLIIQDELHLISGPLGSMVGHYETVIQELCTRRDDNSIIGPKIVASTATISRAADQCHALYNCGKDNVFQFPPQCLRAGDSFFAREDTSAPGRMYIGVHASALPSHVTAQVRVMSALLQAPKSAQVQNMAELDPYWTLIGYFNSLRELGHAATLVNADIKEYLLVMWKRKGITKPAAGTVDKRRYINQILELTSRVDSSTVAASLQKLTQRYAHAIQRPVDICLATNMISVGVDVPRLGLMTVIGQPKTTAEYIQATSRVGRGQDAPGIIVVIYNTGKPRDRSHYEHFRSYHASIYKYVEPTSVTPFAVPVRERALHALLVTLVRYRGTAINLTRPQPYPDQKLIDDIRHLIHERVKGVDESEADETLRLLDEKLEQWRGILPPRYGNFGRFDTQPPLMHPSGTETSPMWHGRTWPTPSSMRDVDAGCEADIIARYP